MGRQNVSHWENLGLKVGTKHPEGHSVTKGHGEPCLPLPRHLPGSRAEAEHPRPTPNPSPLPTLRTPAPPSQPYREEMLRRWRDMACCTAELSS